MESHRKNTLCAIQALNLDQSLDVIKVYFLNDNPTLPKLKDFIAEKISDLSPYQYYHLLSWLLENMNDEMIQYHLDMIFDFSSLDSKNYKDQKEWSVPASDEPLDYSILPERFDDDCYSFFRMRLVTMKYVLDELNSIDLINRVIRLCQSKDAIYEHHVNFDRLFDLMSKDDRMGFPVESFPEIEQIPFYGHALNFIRTRVENENRNLELAITNEIHKEGNNIKSLFTHKNSKELPHVFMDNTILLLPVLMDFVEWKNLVLSLLSNKGIFELVKTKMDLQVNELRRLLNADFFSNLTKEEKSSLAKDEETGVLYLKTYSLPKTHYLLYSSWLQNLDKKDIPASRSSDANDEVPKNQIILSKHGSQKQLKKALADFFEHLKLKIDEKQERALESFIYRNFAFEHDDTVNYAKRTVSNFGYIPIDFIPAKHAKDFAKLFLYLSDKEYLLSNKTNIIKTLDEEIHRKEGKNDGFSYSSLIRIPNDEHHLFPNNEIRQRVRSILKIDD